MVTSIWIRACSWVHACWSTGLVWGLWLQTVHCKLQARLLRSDPYCESKGGWGLRVYICKLQSIVFVSSWCLILIFHGKKSETYHRPSEKNLGPLLCQTFFGFIQAQVLCLMGFPCSFHLTLVHWNWEPMAWYTVRPMDRFHTYIMADVFTCFLSHGT